MESMYFRTKALLDQREEQQSQLEEQMESALRAKAFLEAEIFRQQGLNASLKAQLSEAKFELLRGREDALEVTSKLEDMEATLRDQDGEKQKLQQEVQSSKGESERLRAMLRLCTERSQAREGKMKTFIKELAQKHEQTKAVLSKSQHRELELQAQIAEVQSAHVSLQDQLSKQQAENASLKEDLQGVKAEDSLRTSQELQSYKDEVERLSAKLKQCAEHGKGSKETLEKSMAELAQKHEQTKAVLSKSQHRELELQAQIAEVQSAHVSLQDQLSKQQAENDDLKKLQLAEAEEASKLQEMVIQKDQVLSTLGQSLEQKSVQLKAVGKQLDKVLRKAQRTEKDLATAEELTKQSALTSFILYVALVARNLYIHGRWVYEEELRQGLQQGQEELLSVRASSRMEREALVHEAKTHQAKQKERIALLQAKTCELKDQVAKAQQQKDAVQHEAMELTARCSKLEGDVSCYTARYAAIEFKLHAAQSDALQNAEAAELERQKLQEDLSDYQGKTRMLRQDLEKAELRLQEAEQHAALAASEHRNLNQELHDAKSKESILETALTSQRAENLALQQDLEQAEARSVELQSDLMRSAGEVQQAKQEFSQQQAEHLALQHDLTQAEAQLRAAEGLLAKSDLECYGLKDDIRYLQQNLKQVKDMNSSLKMSVETLQKQKTMIEEELQKTSQVLHEKMEALEAERMKLSAEQSASAQLQRSLRREQRRGRTAQALQAALRQRLEAAHSQGDRARNELREVRGWAESLEETVSKMQQCVDQFGMEALMDLPTTSQSSQEGPALDASEAQTPCPMIALSGSPGDVATPVTGVRTMVHVTRAAAEILSVPTPHRRGRQWSLTPVRRHHLAA
ncbi:unnamed protein product [Cladocopium goreaui]|uniref:Kinesin_K39_putative/GeneDB:LmjF.14.1100/GeneDB:L mjF.14.1110/GeneDB:LmjF.14.1120 n=1 Tax=Cladocopium goreaui TaxID=2562237 RepID=A0A9P1GQQ9_9DINO|nr:unnamed protein product [Cladocopium goreaui]